MADPTTTANIFDGNLSTIVNFVGAAAGLGTAAMGLVDSTKAFCGGPSNFGFGYIQKAVEPFLVKSSAEGAVFGKAQVLRTLKANWLNGVAKPEQKAKAKALIHLGLTQGNAAELAQAAGVNADKLKTVAQKVATGAKLESDEINVLGQFDAIVSAVLDDAYERGDQQYRNASKLLAMLVATILGGIAGCLVYGFGTWQFGLSLLVGVSATPLAPIAKDLTTSLQAAVTAVRVVKR